MDLCSLAAGEMDDALETLLGAEAMRREITAARKTIADLQKRVAVRTQLRVDLAGAENTIAGLQSLLQTEHDERIRAEEKLNMFLRGADMSQEERIIGNYRFRNYRKVSPMDLQPNDAFAVTLVGVVGHGKDWTCYAGRAGQRPAEIADHGNSLPKCCAGIFEHIMQFLVYR